MMSKRFAIYRQICYASKVILWTPSRTATEALLEAGRNTYDLALVDLVLPGGLNGLDVIEKLRSMSQEMRIIACTGFGSVDIANKAVKSGANEFMTKPFWSKRLIDTVNKLLDNKT